MSAKVSRGVSGVELPFVPGFVDEIFGSSGCSAPRRVLPGTTYGRKIHEPRYFTRDPLEFIAGTEFPRTASTLDHGKPQVARKFLGFPIGVECREIRDGRSNPSNRREQQMIAVAAFQIQGEAAL